MGEAAEAASGGGVYSGDGGAGDARAVCRRGRAAPSATQHTAAGRRVRAGRTSAVTSPLSASRADEKQLPASPEQVRERRAGVGGPGGGGRRAARGRGRRRRRRRQEGRAAAEGHALVGAHGRPAGGGRGRGPVRHGAAPHAAAAAATARQVTARRAQPSPPYHAYIPLSGRSDSPGCPRVPEYYRLGIYLFGARPAVP